MIILTLTESTSELVSGFPEYVTLEADALSTIYYTLDGSDPGPEDLIAVGKVYLPTDGKALTIKAIAISVDDSSEVLDEDYSTDSTDLAGPRHSYGDGIVVMESSEDSVNNLSVNTSGEPTQTSSVEFVDLDLKASRVSSSGVMLDDSKTSISFVNFPEKSPGDIEVVMSTPNNNANFDPTARFITMDGSTQQKFEDQVVKVVNRAYNTFGPTSEFYNARLADQQPVITGNYVRSFYNPDNGLYVSYYWESLESRWIQSIQSVDKKTLNIGAKMKHKFVYRWIQDRALSQLF